MRIKVLSELESDYCRYSKAKGNLLRYVYKMFSHPGFRAVMLYRLGCWFRRKNWYHFVGLMERIIFHTCYCQISIASDIAPGFLITHTVGLVIGGGTRIGPNCDVRQNVTFGGNFNKVDEDGRTQPLLNENVSVGAGAVIIGPVKIGPNSIIGANSVVTRDVPANVIVSGSPARVLKERWPVETGRSL
jgi:serine O-acetyltransferase